MRRLGTICLVSFWLACNGTPEPGSVADGEECELDVSCASGYCISINAKKQCASRCPDGTCPSPLICKHAEARELSSPGICTMPSTRLCGACIDDLDCGAAGDICVTTSEGSYCASDCSFTNYCPVGYVCDPVYQAGAMIGQQCLPEGGSCGCDENNIGLERECSVSSDLGACSGYQECLADGSWTTCDASVPSQEVCDNKDNDCDGYYDEDEDNNQLKIECTIPEYSSDDVLPECEGYRYCQNGKFLVCTLDNGRTSSTIPDEEELCDGLDDDCDGERDEGLIGTAKACGACGIVCPPYNGDDINVEGVCNEISGSYECGSPRCKFPYFDVDGDINNTYSSNGCEVKDDTVFVDDEEMLNNDDTRPKVLTGDLRDTSHGNAYHCFGHLPVDSEANHEPFIAIEDMAEDYYSITFERNTDDIDLHLWIDPSMEEAYLPMEFCVYKFGSSCSSSDWISRGFTQSSKYYLEPRWFKGEMGKTFILRFRVPPSFKTSVDFKSAYHFELKEREGTSDTTRTVACTN